MTSFISHTTIDDLDGDPNEPGHEELERLLGHGARVVEDHRGKYGPGTGWVVLEDPEDSASIGLVRGRDEPIHHVRATGNRSLIIDLDDESPRPPDPPAPVQPRAPQG